jgi:hypothetical protein
MHIIAHYRRSVSQYACVRFPAVIVRAFSPKSSLFSGCTFSPFVGCVRVYLVAAFESTPLLHSMCVLAVFECVFLAALVGSANEPWCCTYDCGFEHVELRWSPPMSAAAHLKELPTMAPLVSGASLIWCDNLKMMPARSIALVGYRQVNSHYEHNDAPDMVSISLRVVTIASDYP